MITKKNTDSRNYNINRNTDHYQNIIPARINPKTSMSYELLGLNKYAQAPR